MSDRYDNEDAARERDETFEIESKLDRGGTMVPKQEVETTPTDADESMPAPEPVEVDPAEIEQRGEYREMGHGGALTRAEPSLPVEMSVDDLVARLGKLQDAAEKALVDGVDYGTIPGTNKPSLYKPGAEKLCMLFMLDPETDVEERYDRDGHLSVLARTTIYHAPTGVRLGTGVGSCSTRETRYAYRQAQRECPLCGQETVFKSKKNEGEWYCWSKKGGCGENFDAGSEQAVALSNVDIGRKARPVEELADFYNTVLKMARKRSLVDAVLVTTGASHIYTQDMEDVAPEVAKSTVVEGPPPVSVPKSWPEIEKLVREYDAVAWEAFRVFCADATEMLFATRDASTLGRDERMVLVQKASGAAVALRESVEPGGVPPVGRDALAAAFSSVLDGVQLPGPEWRMSPDETDRPERAAETLS